MILFHKSKSILWLITDDQDDAEGEDIPVNEGESECHEVALDSSYSVVQEFPGLHKTGLLLTKKSKKT